MVGMVSDIIKENKNCGDIFMESVLDVISLVVSISAVLVSIYAVVEARRERKQNLKLEILRDHLKRLEESRNILMDMPETGDKGVIQFNQICALKKLLIIIIWI